MRFLVPEPITSVSSRSLHYPITRAPFVILVFERNDGQADSGVLYLSHGSGYSLFLTRTGATIVLPESEKRRPQKKGSVATTQRERYFKLRFENANPRAEIEGIETLPGTSNYFPGRILNSGTRAYPNSPRCVIPIFILALI
jgi:hypothetical protein